MRNLILVAVLSTALAACNNAAEESDEPAPEATTEAAAPVATETSSAGTYEVTTADGTKFTSTLNADGTYQDTGADGTETEKGTWEDKDGKTCFDSEGGDEQVICFTVGEAAADGTMVATPDDGTDPLTIKKTS